MKKGTSLRLVPDFEKSDLSESLNLLRFRLHLGVMHDMAVMHDMVTVMMNDVMAMMVDHVMTVVDDVRRLRGRRCLGSASYDRREDKR